MPKGRESGMPDEAYWDTFFDARCIVAKLDCGGDGDAVEFGCGYGTFTVPAAQLTTGTIHALDIDPEMVRATADRAAANGLTNVAAVERDFVADGCGLADEAARYGMLFNILHIEEPVRLLREAFRVLSHGGRLGVIHWNRDPNTPRGPSMDIRPRPMQCRAWAEEAGFRHVRDEELGCCSWHWGMVFERPTR